MKSNEIYLGDSLDLMSDIPDRTIDMILADLPYGTTRLKWDCPIDLKSLFSSYERIIKKRGAIVLFGNQPFTSSLITSGINLYKYNWIWRKTFPTGFLNCNYRPLLSFEDIAVFSKSGAGAGSKGNGMKYYPQGLVAINKTKNNKKNSRGTHIHDTTNCGEDNILNSDDVYVQKYTGYPDNILEFDRDSPQLHPTQKPVALFEYLIKTYTNEGDTVLDNVCGSGTTGIACMNTNRNYTLMELDEKFYDVAKKRLEAHSHNSLM